jgi:hypothetical protein
MSSEDTVPKVYGISLELTEIYGPSGPFAVAYAGTSKESADGYFYRDQRGQFGFFAEMRADPEGWDVNGATTGAWSGGLFVTTRENEAAFRQNIAFFFKTRNWVRPERPGDASTVATPVTFSWSIA